MPGPILESLLDQVKQSDLERFKSKVERMEAEHNRMRPEGSVTIEEIMKDRSEKIQLDDFVGIPQSSEEVEQRKQNEAITNQPMDKGSDEIYKNFLNKLRG